MYPGKSKQVWFRGILKISLLELLLLMAMPAPDSEDDPDFETAVVTYDENTAFSIRTIYDGGERYEDSEATEKDLAEDVSINVWREESGGKIRAETIQIINVVF